MKQQAKKAMKELEEVLSQLPLEMKSFAYIDLWRAVQQLFCQQEYALVCGICAAVYESARKQSELSEK